MDEERTTVAVLAHGMLTSMTVVKIAVELLANDAAGPQARETAKELAHAQIALITDALCDLARGLPSEALVMLARR